MNGKEDTLLETAGKLVDIAYGWFKKKSTPKKQERVTGRAPGNSVFRHSGPPLIEQDEFGDPVDRPAPPPAQKAQSGNVSINGRRYNGDVIGIKNGRVMVNGIDVTNDFGNSKTITIDISGDVTMLAVDACEYVKIQGSAGKVETMSGDVTCGDVSGDVTTMSGSVTCGNISGDVETMSGNVRRK